MDFYGRTKKNKMIFQFWRYQPIFLLLRRVKLCVHERTTYTLCRSCAVRKRRFREPEAIKRRPMHGGASSSLCVRTKNWQISVSRRTVHGRRSAGSRSRPPHTRIWFANHSARSCIRSFIGSSPSLTFNTRGRHLNHSRGEKSFGNASWDEAR